MLCLIKNVNLSDRAISHQRCDESKKYDIHLSFSNVSSRLTHRKQLIQRSLDSPDLGEAFSYIERGWQMREEFLEAFKVKKVIQNTTKAI